MIACGCPTISQLPDHPVKVDLAAAKHHHDITGVVLRILIESESRSLSIFLLQSFKRKVRGRPYVGELLAIFARGSLPLFSRVT